MQGITKQQAATLIALLSGIAGAPAKKPARKGVKAAPKVAAPKAKVVTEGMQKARAYTLGADCPFCGSKAAELVAHPTRADVMRAKFDGCKHSINVPVAQ